jgi:Mrp family chromosome partitioning ATPase/uncharacterized protein involved in exopolysaccharide biosynthesis
MRRHAWRGAIAFAVGIALTMVFIKVKPRRYLSQAVLYYQQGLQWDARGESPRDVLHRLRESVLARARLQQTITALDLYPKLVNAGRMEEAIEEMRRRTTFTLSGGDSFTIAFAGESPVQAQRVTATLAEALISDDARSRTEQATTAKGFLEAQTKRVESQLRAKEAELARFLARHPEFAQERRRGGAAEPAPAPPAPAAGPVGPRPELLAAQQAQAELAAARRQLAEQRRLYTEEHPAVAAAATLVKDAEVASQRAAAALEAAERAQGGRPQVVERRTSRVVPVDAEAETEFARLTREAEEQRERFQQLETRQFVASMSATMSDSGHAARISVIDPAYKPSRPIGARTSLLLVMGTAASLLVSLGIAFAFAILDDRVLDRHDVERLGLAPVLASVTLPRPRGRKLLDSGKDEEPGSSTARAPPPGEGGKSQGAASGGEAPGAALATRGAATALVHAARQQTGNGIEQSLVLVRAFAGPPGSGPEADSLTAANFRVLRHRLAERGGLKSILVSSPGVGEGKTTCALGLALALCEAGRAKVLLVEANFRRPALARLLGQQQPVIAPDEPELPAEQWSSVEQVTPWLHLAAASRERQAPFVDGPSMRLRLEQLGSRGYDFIVIDGPPVLGSADVNLIQESVSGILLTMWARRSSASSLREAIDQIGSRKVLGVVLMGT